ncbi:MAG: elongation factor G [Merismopedia sp. SIO2A8]|nr:elongation factor G [Symploca sp. SIO2B6]NET48596.1 elongation factor G [Merismopedia sp. SIO2A8]
MTVPLGRIRNIGISAHIDSGKTTLSERILYYTGRIHRMGDVRGKDIGATMDSRPDETTRGITIVSAATSCIWNDVQINLIDTPGHVDFTIEVERALRVLDGAVMVLCAVAGVQAQSITVDRQMKRYQIPRIAFINKMDRAGADPFRVVTALRDRLHLNPVLLQYPLWTEAGFEGVIDLITLDAHWFEGEHGEQRVMRPVPVPLAQAVQEARDKLLDQLSMVSDELLTALVAEESISEALIWDAIRQATLRHEIVPVLMGSAYKNKGVQDLLDAVERYLPSPLDRGAVSAQPIQSSLSKDMETEFGMVTISPEPDGELVALAFKLTVEPFGQLTYTRIYSGTLKPGQMVYNSRTGDRVHIGRMVKMHADKQEVIASAQAGDIIALLGVDCASGDTFTSQPNWVTLEGIFVPDAVITRAIYPKTAADGDRMAKALNRFCKEDPTFRVSVDQESGATLVSGMGELHLDIYLDRMREDYDAQVELGNPAVAYRETIGAATTFDYRFKKQTGGPGQYAHVIGRIEPIDDGFEFEDKVVGGAIPKPFISSCERGFQEAMTNGVIDGYPVMGVRVVLEGGSTHATDSSEWSFRHAARIALAQAMERANPKLLEPIMAVSVETPSETIGRVQGDLLSRRGILVGSDTQGEDATIRAEVPLSEMFGYSTQLRSLTAGMANFSMEFARYL